MSDMPQPLTPADADLQDFSFMPMDIVRLFGSRFHAVASDAEWRAGVTLWLKSFHQVPAASLPDDDVELTRLAEMGRHQRGWRKLRAGALHGWVKCSDGRLYHPVVAEKANEAWNSKLRQRHRTYCAAVRKHNERHGDDKRDAPDFETWLDQDRPDRVTRSAPTTSRTTEHNVARDNPPLSHVTPREKPCDIASKGEGQGEGEGIKEEEPPSPPALIEPDTPVPGATAGKRYAFEGLTVRLTEGDLAGWRKTFHAIPDIAAELTAIDTWWQRQLPEKRKDWFVSTSGMLNRKHQDFVRAAAAAETSGQPADFTDYVTQRRKERETWERKKAERERC